MSSAAFAKKTFSRIGALVAVVLVWQAICKLAQVPAYILPAPVDVFLTLLADKSILWFHSAETLEEWSIGLALSMMLSLVLSCIAFESKTIEKALGRVLVVSQSVPYLTVAPLLLLWFGLGSAPKIILIVLTCCFPMTQLTLSGLQAAKLEYGVLSAILRLDNRAALARIYAPAALPHFFEGVRISVTYAFVSSVLAELIGSEAGLGVYLSRAQSAYRTDRVMAAVIIIVTFSLLCNWIVGKVSQKTLFWKVKTNV